MTEKTCFFQLTGFLGDVIAEKHTFFRPLTSSLRIPESFIQEFPVPAAGSSTSSNKKSNAIRARHQGTKTSD
jgi:hypothetical protein